MTTLAYFHLQIFFIQFVMVELLQIVIQLAFKQIKSLYLVYFQYYYQISMWVRVFTQPLMPMLHQIKSLILVFSHLLLADLLQKVSWFKVQHLQFFVHQITIQFGLKFMLPHHQMHQILLMVITLFSILQIKSQSKLFMVQFDHQKLIVIFMLDFSFHQKLILKVFVIFNHQIMILERLFIHWLQKGNLLKQWYYFRINLKLYLLLELFH